VVTASNGLFDYMRSASGYEVFLMGLCNQCPLRVRCLALGITNVCSSPTATVQCESILAYAWNGSGRAREMQNARWQHHPNAHLLLPD